MAENNGFYVECILSVTADIFEAGFVPAENYGFCGERSLSVAAEISEAGFVPAGITEDRVTDKTNTARTFINKYVLHDDIVVHLF